MNTQEHKREIERLKAEVKNGNVSVARHLGALIYGGQSGKEKNYAAAKEYFFISATKANDAKMQYWLAKHYENGDVVKQDLSLAVMWYYCAAYQGHTEAQYNLGRVLHNNGYTDNYEWLHWICCAALHGEKTACSWLQELNGYGFVQKLKIQSVAKKLTASIEENGIIPESNGINATIDPRQGRANAIINRDFSDSSKKAHYDELREIFDLIIKNRSLSRQ